MNSTVTSLAERTQKDAQPQGISVTLGQLLEAVPQEPGAVSALSVLVNQSLPVRLSFRLGMLTKAVNAQLAQFNESRQALCERYASKDDEGKVIRRDREGNIIGDEQPGNFEIPKENVQQFNDEYSQLLSMEVTLPGQRISISELAGLCMSPVQLMTLDWLIASD